LFSLLFTICSRVIEKPLRICTKVVQNLFNIHPKFCKKESNICSKVVQK
jgi:hypothetical protein